MIPMISKMSGSVRGQGETSKTGMRKFFSAAAAVMLAGFAALAPAAAGRQQKQDKTQATSTGTQNSDHADKSDLKPGPAQTAISQKDSSATGQASAKVAHEEDTQLQKAVRAGRVITDDDLAQALTAPNVPDESRSSDPYCDADSRDQLRYQTGVQPGHEQEFRNQLTLAEHDVAGDHVWTAALRKALDAAQSYCQVEQQKAAVLSKGRASPYIAANPSFQLSKREKKLRYDEIMAAGYVKERIQQVQVFDGFRAALMQQIWSTGANGVCPGTPLP
jgi:hypothetical protein